MATLIGIVAIVIVVLGATVFPAFARATKIRLTATCERRLAGISTSISMYRTDYDDTMPDPGRWMDQLGPLAAPHRAIFGNPRRTLFHCPSAPGSFGYAFNSALAHKKGSQVDPNTPVIFDSDLLERNANSSLETLPTKPRHVSGQNPVNVILYGGNMVRLVRPGH